MTTIHNRVRAVRVAMGIQSQRQKEMLGALQRSSSLAAGLPSVTFPRVRGFKHPAEQQGAPVATVLSSVRMWHWLPSLWHYSPFWMLS